MQKRTISIKLITTPEQGDRLLVLQRKFVEVCNQIVPFAVKKRCWNSVNLHKTVYTHIRETTSLGAQLTCNSIRKVCNAFKALKLKKTDSVPLLQFKQHTSIHYDANTYTIKGEILSLYTLSGRIEVPMVLSPFHRQYLEQGVPKEAELVYRNKTWFFNLVLDIPNPEPRAPSGNILGIDLGENVLAATSSGKFFDGKLLRHTRYCARALRRRLQSNGSKSSKQRLRKISGSESRHITHMNHIISKAIVQEAIDTQCDTIALENLKNILKRIKVGKRMRFRLYGWAWAQLQRFILYKAQAAGLKVVFVNPAYTSKKCAECGNLGTRDKHRFVCKICDIQRHSDYNASLNIRRIAASADAATGTVNSPHVGAA